MTLVKYPDEGPGPRVLTHHGVVNSEKFITYVNDFGKELNSISCRCRQALVGNPITSLVCTLNERKYRINNLYKSL